MSSEMQIASIPATQSGHGPGGRADREGGGADDREQRRDERRAELRDLLLLRLGRHDPPPVSRSRASRTRKSAPRHSWSSVVDAAGAVRVGGLDDVAGRVAGARRARRRARCARARRRRAARARGPTRSRCGAGTAAGAARRPSRPRRAGRGWRRSPRAGRASARARVQSSPTWDA